MNMENKNYIIYKAQNTLTRECYIGATTKSIEIRKYDHYLKSKNGSLIFFHKALKTYGVENFNWSVIDIASTNNELAEKETKHIEYYNSIHNGYNSVKGSNIKKSVYQFDINTHELINSFEDLASAANKVNASKKSISDVCLNYNTTCKGYFWSYSSSLVLSSNFDKRKKAVKQFSLDGVFLTNYDSAAKASAITGVSKTCITRCCRGERPKSGGFIWNYL